jgi:hypothetical protein
MVPWDDDVDMYVPWTERKRVEKALLRLAPSYVLKKASTRWKLYAAVGSAPIPGGWRWHYPFVDICFYVEKGGFVHDYDLDYASSFRFRRSSVFPVTRRPFMNMSLNAPRDTLAVLLTNYDVDVCQTNKYNHRRELYIGQVYSVDCRQLWTRFPFVFRSKLSGGGRETIVEKLKVGDRVLGSFVTSASDV